MSEHVLNIATSLGLPTRRVVVPTVGKAAASCLPITEYAVPITVSAGVVEVLTAHVPTPSEFAALERATTSGVTITVTTPEILAHARTLAEAALVSSALSLPAVLDDAVRQDAAVRMVSLTPNNKPTILTPTGTYPLTAVGALDQNGFEQLATMGDLAQVVEVSSGRWRVQKYDSALVATRVQSGIASPAELGLPRLVESLTLATAGLVLVSGRPGSGRTTAASSLASRSGSPFYYVSSSLDAPVDPSQFVRSLLDLPASNAPVVIDTPDELDSLTQAVSLAAAGYRVYVVVSAASMATALTLLAGVTTASQLASVWVGSTHVACLTGTKSNWEHVYGAAVATPATTAAVLTASQFKLAQSWDALGSQFVLPLHLTLARAVSAGKVPLKTAEAASGDVPRFTMALGDWDVSSPEALSEQII